MKKVKRDWLQSIGLFLLSIPFAAAGLYVLKFDISNRSHDMMSISIGAVLTIIGLHLLIASYNNYTSIDPEKNLLSLPGSWIPFRKHIKISEIKSIETETRRNATNNGRIKEYYVLHVYGDFGRRSVMFSTFRAREDIVYELKSL